MNRLLAVLGQDVSASLSPRLHLAASEACALGLAYVPLSCPTESDFYEMVQALRVLKARGCNVTIPYKRAAFQVADHHSAAAKDLGVANTLTFEGNQIHADNTDGEGLKQILHKLDPNRLQRVQILGAGGAARAAVWAVHALGAEEIFVCARRNVESVAALAGDRGIGRPLERIANVSLVISALPNEALLAAKALDDWIDLSRQPTIFDLAYGSLDKPSPLVQAARSQGLEAVDGRGMLIEQAALSLNRWVGGQVSERIRKAMWEALGSSG
jgi:shikimate dehydrogenase